MNGDFQLFKTPGRSKKLDFMMSFSRSSQHVPRLGHIHMGISRAIDHQECAGNQNIHGTNLHPWETDAAEARERQGSRLSLSE